MICHFGWHESFIQPTTDYHTAVDHCNSSKCSHKNNRSQCHNLALMPCLLSIIIFNLPPKMGEVNKYVWWRHLREPSIFHLTLEWYKPRSDGGYFMMTNRNRCFIALTLCTRFIPFLLWLLLNLAWCPVLFLVLKFQIHSANRDLERVTRRLIWLGWFGSTLTWTIDEPSISLESNTPLLLQDI